MNIDEIQQKLAALDADVVKDFLLNLYQQSPELQEQIETLVLYDDPAALAKVILKRIQSVSRGRKFIDWRLSHDFSANLDSILADIESGLLDSSPKHAFDLVTKFLATANKVFERADDSSGEIGGVYQDSVLLWLTAAKAWKESTAAGAKINWLERVYTLYLDNDYAVYDVLLPNSAILLNPDQLTQLAWRYESELKQALKTPSEKYSFNMEALHGSVALGAVAEALKDPALYERATLITSPEPNDLQKKSIVQMYLKFDQTDGALRWLNTPWQTRFETDRLALLDEAHQQSGNVDELKKTRFKFYSHDQTYSSFKRYLELLNDTEQQSARLEAIQLAEQGGELTANIDMLLNLNEPERAQLLVLANPQGISNCFYGDLLELAKKLEQQKCWLAATACYRSLLLDILNRARSKAYTHAARYYKKLEIISEQIQHFEPLDNHAEFIQQLKDKHGLKRSFWQRVMQ
ncbi:MAG: hypothetical protein KAU21_19065 [Gammaproteobacteria bacterium]|nr:hypothetical protein [Gammaproteobacteria bacterium]